MEGKPSPIPMKGKSGQEKEEVISFDYSVHLLGP